MRPSDSLRRSHGPEALVLGVGFASFTTLLPAELARHARSQQAGAKQLPSRELGGSHNPLSIRFESKFSIFNQASCCSHSFSSSFGLCFPKEKFSIKRFLQYNHSDQFFIKRLLHCNHSDQRASFIPRQSPVFRLYRSACLLFKLVPGSFAFCRVRSFSPRNR